MPSVLCQESDPRVSDLRSRLDEFYRTTTVYSAFKETAVSPTLWAPILQSVRDKADARPDAKVRILEFGAGRSGFGDFLGDMRPRVELTMQDVTPQNADFLATQGQHVHVGDVLDLKGPYDVIFSTFVWEHVSNPRRTLDHLLGTLAPGGSLYLASPRYDLPVYVPPSARHYGLARRIGLMTTLMALRARAMFGGEPGFVIHTDPSMFHGPWYRDADAIHWPSIYDLHRALPAGFTLEKMPVHSDGGLKATIWARFLLLFVRISRSDSTPQDGRPT